MSFNLPNFVRRRKLLEVIEFVPVKHVFKPMVAIRIRNTDINGHLNDDKTTRKQWAMPAGSVQIIDEAKAREFVAKGYAEFVHEPRQPLSPDEIAEHQASVTRISL